MREKEAIRLAKWAREESLKLAEKGTVPGSRLESEAIQNWQSQRPDLYRWMETLESLPELAHVLVDRMVDQEEAYLAEGYPLDDAKVTAYADWMMMDPGTTSPRRLPEPTTI
jgi:hypothetical protein